MIKYKIKNISRLLCISHSSMHIGFIAHWFFFLCIAVIGRISKYTCVMRKKHDYLFHLKQELRILNLDEKYLKREEKRTEVR